MRNRGIQCFREDKKNLDRYPIAEHCPARGHDSCYFCTAVPLTSLSKPEVFILYGDGSVPDAAWGQQVNKGPKNLGAENADVSK